VEMQKEIGEHHDDAITPVDRHRMPKDALPDLRFVNDFAKAGHGLLTRVMIHQ
jgi:hypothetical protein